MKNENLCKSRNKINLYQLLYLERYYIGADKTIKQYQYKVNGVEEKVYTEGDKHHNYSKVV